MNAVIYTRYSSNSQWEESIEGQRQLVAVYKYRIDNFAKGLCWRHKNGIDTKSILC